MALWSCPDCGSEVSSNAKHCPRCGCDGSVIHRAQPLVREPCLECCGTGTILDKCQICDTKGVKRISWLHLPSICNSCNGKGIVERSCSVCDAMGEALQLPFRESDFERLASERLVRESTIARASAQAMAAEQEVLTVGRQSKRDAWIVLLVPIAVVGLMILVSLLSLSSDLEDLPEEPKAATSSEEWLSNPLSGMRPLVNTDIVVGARIYIRGHPQFASGEPKLLGQIIRIDGDECIVDYGSGDTEMWERERFLSNNGLPYQAFFVETR